MRFKATLSLILALTLQLTAAFAVESTWEYSVQVSSTVQASPAQVTLSWPQDTNGVPSSYTIFRKAPSATSWGSGTTLPGSATTYTDTSVSSGTAYEYRIVKAAGSYTGYGYIQTGINAPLVDNRGKIVLVVDSTFTASLAAELARLQQDLAGDGWTVIRRDVGRSDSVASVKAVIKSAYDSDPANVKSVFLFGHVPVPYSGQLNPDGHADHTGAWPADAYYGDVDGNWTDTSVNYTQTLNTDPKDAARLSNRPGDGKFDQTTLPSSVELEVGRVDLANLPGRTTWGGPATFASETELLRKYLNKDHAFRHGATNTPRRAIVGDYFGARGGEAFAASGFRNFAPLVGANNIRNLNTEFNDARGVWIPQVAQNSYLLAYACGAGSYASISGIGSGLYNGGDTVELVNSNVRGVFNLIFGSWLGDWDSEDNILRAPLATDSGLVSVWSGRPHWFMHPLGLGETVGNAARLTQNNAGLYQTQINSSENRIHIALMGDPSLRLHPVAPARAVSGSQSGSTAALTWQASSDTNVTGYHVYRAAQAAGPYTRLTSSPVSAINFNDPAASAGATYMVRAVKLETSASGSYQNASQGIFWSANGGSSTNVATAVSASTTEIASTTATTSSTTPTTTTTTASSSAPATALSGTAGSVVWFDDALPAGASSTTWNWVTANPAPFSGAKAHQTALASGLHDYSFNWGAPLAIATGDVLYAHIYLDPANPPAEIMLSWVSDTWEHRAYWGGNHIQYGTNDTNGRRSMGALPATGQWVRLAVPASAVGLEGASVQGMGLSLFDGRATLDYVGKADPQALAPATAATPSTTSTVLWFDDALPAGAGTNSTWNWIAGNPAPLSGAKAHQTALAAGLHEYSFNWAAPFAIAPGESLVTNVYLDPANPPSEIMLSWVSDNWEHRAYWGSNNIQYGTDRTASRHYMGALPAAGQWVRLEVPASAVGLEGAGLQGMGFSLFNGRATFDATGKTSNTSTTANVVTAQATTTTATTQPSAPVDSTLTVAPIMQVVASSASVPLPLTAAASGDTIWFDDALPAGSGGAATGGDAWTWVPSAPTPISGTVAHQSNIKKGLHEHSFNWSSEPLIVAAGEKLFVYVQLDPANPPTEIMVSWCADNWEHRAFWGADSINYGRTNTTSRYNAGALPATGQWVRLEVPASAVGLEGAVIRGMSFSLFDGRATWDKTGKAAATSASTTTTVAPSSTTATTSAEIIWFDDALPAGAGASASGGDAWNWISTNPAPFSGSKAHQTVAQAGLHETSFNWAGATMSVAATDPLFAYVYIDPANVPSSIMLSWCDGSWEHRAYWGADKIDYGTKGTVGRVYAGPLPAAGQWVRLAVPASAVGLSGSTVQGMTISLFDGRATFDKVGKGGSAATVYVAPSTPTTTTTTATTTATPTTTSTTTTTPTTSTTPTIVIASTPTTTPTTTTTTTTTTASTPSTTTTATTTTALAENSAFTLPKIGDNALTIVSPTSLELRRILTKAADPAPMTEWNFVDANGVFTAPATSQFAVTVNGQAVTVKSVGFRRRVAYAPQNYRDLRVDNSLYLELSSPIAEGQSVEVKNASGAHWPASMQFKSVAHALRYSPAIHVNQEGYIPSLPKKAMVGYYLGSLGELDVPSQSFKIVAAATGATVYQGTLTSRLETGFIYTPKPYQKVWQADFSSFTTAGEYQLVVPGLGASLPFLINEGVAMAFTRTYALGVYSQRCGHDNSLPFSRFIHAACHMASAEVPSPSSSYGFTWTTIASKNEDAKSNPRHTAPRLDSEAAQLYPFVNKGTVNVTGGHHDAGDYSKYTINVGQLVHQLGFTAESIGGAGAMDNLGLPQSGDGISDILQEAKIEADYVAKLQDADGGFYFIVYPKTRAYEGNVTPDKGDQQVVWPKNTSATAVGVAALAQMASSPKFKAAYPTEAAAYLQKAKLGWQFLLGAIAKHGKDGAYQKVTFYGDQYMHDDELAWAAAEMFAATGEAQYHQKLMEWFPNPSDSNTFRYGWLRMHEGWGNAIRAYAFAARSGRLATNQLNAAYLAKCEEQVKLAGDDALNWSRQSAYGSSFPEASKHVLGAGWYFSLDQASDIGIAYQLNPRPEYVDALLANLNYEAGTNPVNVTFVTGLGLKRQRELVNQWANTDHRKMPMPGIPVGNITGTFSYVGTYGAVGNELGKLSFPSDDTGNRASMTPFYDRWSDTWNVTAEFITMNQARAITSAATIASLTSAKSTPWKPATTIKIVTPSATVQVGAPLTLTFDAAGLDLTNARILWEARDQEPDFGSTYAITPQNPGAQWVEIEIIWPDGRRLVGTGSYNANSAVITWVDDALPTGANPGSLGGDGWNWVSNPTPKSGTKVHQTPAGVGLREHSFNDAWSPLTVGTGDTMFAWVYLDPAAMPEEIMLHWNAGSWEHRAYWGANKIGYGTDGTASRRHMGAIPAGGGWVKLEVPASAVGLEGRSITGMCFSTFGGGVVSWDAAGRTTPMN